LTLFGAALVLAGAVAMWRGWDIVQVERGWTLFIAGAALFSGGAIVIALAEVVARLDQLLARPAEVSRPPVPPPISAAPPAAAPQPLKTEDAPPTVETSLLARARLRSVAAAPPEPAREEPQEVDRYQSGELTYVMYSDGSVEVRSATSVQRYPSLAALRDQAMQQS
jgi:hypothetical protein